MNIISAIIDKENLEKVIFPALYIIATVAVARLGRWAVKRQQKSSDISQLDLAINDVFILKTKLIEFSKAITMPRQIEIDLGNFLKENTQSKIESFFNKKFFISELNNLGLSEEQANSIILKGSEETDKILSSKGIEQSFLDALYAKSYFFNYDSSVNLYNNIIFTKLSLDFNIEKIKFVNKYNIYAVNAVLALQSNLNTLNEAIINFNKLVENQANGEKNKVQNILLNSCNMDIIQKISETLAFANISYSLLIKCINHIIPNHINKKTLPYESYNDLRFSGVLPLEFEYLLNTPDKPPLRERIKRTIADWIW